MTSSTGKQTLAALPGIGVSLLPKLMCPACWPAYAGLVSALGLGFLISTQYLLPLTVVFLALTAWVLGYRASRRHGAVLVDRAAACVGRVGEESSGPLGGSPPRRHGTAKMVVGIRRPVAARRGSAVAIPLETAP